MRQWKKDEKSDGFYDLILDYNSKKGWLQFAILSDERGYVLWHMENSDPCYDSSCILSYEIDDERVFTAGHESRVRYVLEEIRADFINTEGLIKKDKEGLILLLEKVEECFNK